MKKFILNFKIINKSIDCYLIVMKYIYDIYLFVKGKSNKNYCGYIEYYVVCLNSKVFVCIDFFNVFL